MSLVATIAILYNKECFRGLLVSIATDCKRGRCRSFSTLSFLSFKFVRYIDTTQHLLVYSHAIFTRCFSSITLLYTQSSVSFCFVCLINQLKVWQGDARITHFVVIMTSSTSMMILSSFQFIGNNRMTVIYLTFW